MVRLHVQLAVLTTLFLGAAAGSASEWDETQVRTILHKKIDVEKRMRGVSLALVDSSGIRTFHHGVACDGGPAVSDATVYEVGSLTKPVTSAVMARMQDAGKIEPQERIAGVLAPRHRLGVSAFANVTLQQLAEHTSGLPRMPEDLQSPADYSAAQAYAFLERAKPATAKPGERLYSNFGYGVLGHLLEVRGGQPYPELVARYVLRPLAMKSATFGSPKGGTACGHDEALNPVPPTLIGPMLAPSGALKATIRDMALFLQASVGLGTGPAMKWGRVQDVRGLQLIGHDGSTDGFFGYAAYDPGAKRGVVVLANSRFDVRDIPLHLLQPAYPLVPRRQAVAFDEVDRRRLPGSYEEEAGPGFEIASYGDRMLLMRPGQPIRDLFAERAGRVFADDARPISVVDQEGQTLLTMYMRDGTSTVAKRRDSPSITFAPLPTPDLRAVLGTYRLPDGDDIVLTHKDRKIYAQLSGQAALEVLPVSRTRLVYRDVAAELEFVPGSPSPSVVIIQNGNQTTGTRTSLAP